jgi:hypothetical protein
MEENYKLLSAVLQRLQDSGALEKLILTGSWVAGRSLIC